MSQLVSEQVGRTDIKIPGVIFPCSSQTGIGDFHVGACVPLWQSLALQKTRLMLQHQDEEPYAGILDNFRQQMSSEQTEVFKQLSGNQQHTLLLYLNEVVTLHLEKEDVIKPNYQ